VLIGEPGVGKTAIVEGLAQRIVNGEVPETLQEQARARRSTWRRCSRAPSIAGEFEERLKAVLKDIAAMPAASICSSTRLHTMVGAGKAEGAMDAGNMLKPALARGELHCVGRDDARRIPQSTSRRTPHSSGASRRCSSTSRRSRSTIAILARPAGALRDPPRRRHHRPRRSSRARGASHRYITDRFLPDKAIDLIDEAAARIKMEIDSKPEAMDRLDRG
jgi:ATP-dependent Clp protease ATP-binding subunit ClpB